MCLSTSCPELESTGEGHRVVVMRSAMARMLRSSKNGPRRSPVPPTTAIAAKRDRFEVDDANAARSFLKGRGISTQQMQVVWDAIALHTTRSIALHKEPEVAMTHSGITADVLGASLDRISQDKQGAILAEFPRLALKTDSKSAFARSLVASRSPPLTTSFGISAFDMSRGTHPPTLPMSSRMHHFSNRLPPDHRIAHAHQRG
jgi:hypothetical protein